MSWVKIDDRYPWHKKLAKAGPSMRAFAMALDVTAMCHAALHKTDGFVDDDSLPDLYVVLPHGKGPRAVAALVQVGRWERDDQRGGYLVHHFLDYNPSAAEREAMAEQAEQRRAADRQRKQAQRRGTKDVRRMSARNPSGQAADRAKADGHEMVKDSKLPSGRRTRNSTKAGHETATTRPPQEPSPQASASVEANIQRMSARTVRGLSEDVRTAPHPHPTEGGDGAPQTPHPQPSAAASPSSATPGGDADSAANPNPAAAPASRRRPRPGEPGECEHGRDRATCWRCAPPGSPPPAEFTTAREQLRHPPPPEPHEPQEPPDA